MKFLWCLLLLSCNVVNGDIFSSTSHLSSLMYLERHLISQMATFIEQMEYTVRDMKNYLDEFSRSAGRTEFQGKYASEEIIGNPLQAFQILKRLTINWAEIQEKMGHNNWKQIEQLISEYNIFMPKEEDLNGAALALVRLQDTYNLNMSDLARGEVLGYQSRVEMSARDCLYLGKQSFNNGYYGHSIDWFEEALIRAHKEGNQTASVNEIAPFHQMAVQIHDQYQFSQNELEDSSNYTSNYTSKPKKLRFVEGDNEDFRNYQRLCRGEDIKTSAEEKNLKCYLTNNGHPLLLMQPVRVEVFHEKPFVAMFHNLMTNSEMELLKELAAPILTRARVQTDSGKTDEVSKVRTSQTAWFSPENHETIGRINERIESVTGLSVNMDKSHCELVQVANYGIGGHYVPHYDYLIVDRPPEQRHLVGPRELYSGDRTATLMFYLTDVIKGGSTVFPRLGVKVTPRKGSAVFWYNLFRNGEGIEDTVHGACPVLMGEKWVANYWIREVGQAFRRKCTLNEFE